MLENATIIKLEIEVMAQRIMQQYILHNEQIEKNVEVGIKNAFDKFNFENEVERIATEAIKRSIELSFNYGKISEVVKKKSDEILSELADKYFENMRAVLSK